MRVKKRSIGVVLGVVAAALGFAGVAWACTAQVGIAPLAVQAAAPQTRLVLSGDSATPGIVEIRWNGVRGPILATAMADGGQFGSGFSTEITVPAVDPGVYYLVLVAGDQGLGRAAIEVTPPTAGNLAASSAADAIDGPWEAFSSAPHESLTQEPAGNPLEPGVILLTVGLAALALGFGAAGARRALFLPKS
ncbi:MAG TPA: hypothetical protein VNA57_11930 [Acidimicrobiales bacterium]|nr:hypothetical protein [Acidimicrobiales bacterium]